MPLRGPAKPNIALDVMVEMISEIAGERGRFIGPVPQTVARIYDIKAASGALPAYFVQFVEEKPDLENASNLLHWSWLYFVVWAVVSNPEQPDVDLHELVADLKLKLLEDGQARLRARMTNADPGEIIFDGYKSGVAIMNVDGKALAPVLFRVEYKWSHEAP